MFNLSLKKMLRRILNLVIWPPMNFIFSHFDGLENLPREMGYVVVGNHTSHLDGLVVYYAFRKYVNREVIFMAHKEQYKNSLLRLLLDTYDTIPINQKLGLDEGENKKYLDWAIHEISGGNILIMFPEGHRSTTGRMSRWKTGAIRIAVKAKKPILPMAIRGTYSLWPKRFRFPRLNKESVSIKIGRRIDVSKYENTGEKMIRGLTNNTQKRVERMLRDV